MDVGGLQQVGLYDPHPRDAADRLALEHLDAQGISVQEMVEADERGRLVQVKTLHDVNIEARSLNLRDVAERTGTSLDCITSFHLALGFLVEERPSRARERTRGLRRRQTLPSRFHRPPSWRRGVRTRAPHARIRQAARGLFEAEVQSTLRMASELERAAAEEIAHAAWDVVADALSLALLECRTAIYRHRIVSSRTASSYLNAVAVSFVDLVDSTAWAQRLSLRDHAIFPARFEEDVWNLAAAHNARVVKLIGDEVMFVARSAHAAVMIASGLCDAVADDAELPAARGAIGFGTTLSRDGDYFGAIVNVVSRCVKRAPTGGIVVTNEARQELDETNSPVQLDALGGHEIRGVDPMIDPFLVRT